MPYSFYLRADILTLLMQNERKKIKIGDSFFEPEIPGFVDEKAKFLFHRTKKGRDFFPPCGGPTK